MTDATHSPCGQTPQGNTLIEELPCSSSRYPDALQELIDRYGDPDAEGALFLVAAAVAIEHSWGYLESPSAGASADAGPRAGYYALESLDRWLRWEKLFLSPALGQRFAGLRRSIAPYFVQSPGDWAPQRDVPLGTWLEEMDRFLADFAAEVAPFFHVATANRPPHPKS
jgi:hypothetical protein